MIVVLSGCSRVGRIDNKEQKNRLLVRAYSMENKGKYDAAIALLNKALIAHPDFARPHFDVAMLLQDRKHDYIRAIYHYNRYLEMRPGTEKRKMILERIRQAENSFIASRVAEPGRMSFTDMENMCARLRNRNAALSNKIVRLEKELAGWRDRDRRAYIAEVAGNSTAGGSAAGDGEKLLSAASDQTGRVSADAGGRIATNAAHSRIRSEFAGNSTVTDVRNRNNAAPVTNREAAVHRNNYGAGGRPHVRTYTVRKGDSLTKIALKVYGDSALWPKIRDANRNVLRGREFVQTGQVLKIP
jgi:hypothetical protein